MENPLKKNCNWKKFVYCLLCVIMVNFSLSTCCACLEGRKPMGLLKSSLKISFKEYTIFSQSGMPTKELDSCNIWGFVSTRAIRIDQHFHQEIKQVSLDIFSMPEVPRRCDRRTKNDRILNVMSVQRISPARKPTAAAQRKTPTSESDRS